MRKLFFAIGMMAIMSAASAAAAPAAGDDKPAYGCVVTCEGTKCGPEYVDVDKAIKEMDEADDRCRDNMEQQQAPPELM